MNKRHRSKLTHVIGVCGLVLGTLTSAGTVAGIVQLSNAPASVAVVHAAGTVADDSTARVLNLHKYQAQDNDISKGTAATGTAADAANLGELKPMAGVQFKIYKVSAEEAKGGADSITPDASTLQTTLTTDASGNASFTAGTGTDADGYYLVVEQDNAAVKDKSKPFLVHLPMTMRDDKDKTTGLSYSVDVYPKNTIDTDSVLTHPEKTLQDGKLEQSVQAGNDISWTLTAQRPSDAKSADGKYATRFAFSDPINTKSLEYKAVQSVAITGTDADGAVTSTALTLTDDYTVTTTDKGDFKVVVIELTEAGLQKLGDAPAGSTIAAQITTKVLNTNDAAIQNTFDTYYTGTVTDTPTHETTVPDPDPDPDDPDKPQDPDNGTDPTDPDTPDPDDNTPHDNQPVVYMGNVDLIKQTENGEALPNATFKIAIGEDEAKAGTFLKDAEGKDIQVTTDDKGLAEITGLQVDDGTHTRKYYLVETDAPVGYDVDGLVHEVTATQDTVSDVTVKDPDNAIPNLPLTGAQGRILVLAVASVTLIGTGTYLIVRKRRELND